MLVSHTVICSCLRNPSLSWVSPSCSVTFVSLLHSFVCYVEVQVKKKQTTDFGFIAFLRGNFLFKGFAMFCLQIWSTFKSSAWTHLIWYSPRCLSLAYCHEIKSVRRSWELMVIGFRMKLYKCGTINQRCHQNINVKIIDLLLTFVWTNTQLVMSAITVVLLLLRRTLMTGGTKVTCCFIIYISLHIMMHITQQLNCVAWCVVMLNTQRHFECADVWI